MADYKLAVKPRTVLGKKVAALRRGGITPGNVYGHRLESAAVQVETHEMQLLIRRLTKNAIVNLSVEGETGPRTVIIRKIERNPLNGKLVHIDFFQVSMTEKMKAQVPVVLSGSSPAVGTYGGVLLQTLEMIEVEALPTDIPTEFSVDVTVLAELEQSIHVRDLHLEGEGVQILTDPDLVVAKVASPRLAAEEEAAAAPAEGEAAEGEGAEGEAAAAAPEGEKSE
jgi:large subunit ribosomal protein L25